VLRSALSKLADSFAILACLLVTLPSHSQREPDPIGFPLPAPVEQLLTKPAWRVFVAVDIHDHEALQSFLNQGDSPNRPAPNHNLPLTLAAQIGDLDAIRILLKAGAEVNPDPSFASPLRQAVEFAQIDAINLLLVNGAQPNARNVVGETPLFSALRHRRYDLLKLLIHAGADVSLQNKAGDTPLMIAALDDDFALINFLRESGANFNNPDEELLYAASYGDVAAIQRVLSQGARVNCHYGRDVTPLMAAALNGQTAAVRQLIAAGADLNARDEVHATPLLYAIKGRHKSTIFVLIDAGADVTLFDLGGVTTLLQAAIYLDDPDLVQLLLKRDVPNDGSRSPIQYAPLMAAAGSGHVETVRLLLAAGAEVNAQSKEGLTPLMDAALGGNAEVIDLLLHAGADPTLKSKAGKLAVDYAREIHGPDSPSVALLEKPAPTAAQSPQPH